MQPEQPRDRIERHFVAVVQREYGALGLVEVDSEKLVQPVGATALLGELVRCCLDSCHVIQHVLFIHQRSWPLDPVQRGVACDAVQPRRELRRPPELVEVTVRLQEHVLREIRRGFTIASHSITPPGHAFVMPREQLVEDGFSRLSCEASAFGDELIVRELRKGHPAGLYRPAFAKASARQLCLTMNETRRGAPAERESAEKAHGTILTVRNLFIVLAVVAFQTGIHGQGPATGVASARNPAQAALSEGARLEEAGDTAGALEAYRRAVNEAGSVSRDRADALIALANLQTVLGKYGDGRAHAREAATIFGTLGETRDKSMALNHAGLASLYEGDYGEAERDFRSAIDLSRAMKDPDGLAEQIGNLGNVMFFRGRYADAARLYDEALGVTASAGAAAWVPRRRRILLANQASLFQRLGRDREALALYDQLGASSSELPAAEHAQLLANLGVLYRRLGDPVKALETYDAARALFARDRHVDGEIGVLNKRGIVLALDLGRLDEAELTFSGALDAATRAGNRREALHAHLYRAETLLRAGKTARARADYEAALELSRTLKTPEEEWKALYGIGRTKSGAESVEALTRAVTAIEGIREGIRVPSLRSDFLTDKREVYDSLLASRLAADVPAGEIFSLLERSHSRVWRERLGLPAQVDLAAVQRLLPDGVLILDYWHSALGSAVIAITRTAPA